MNKDNLIPVILMGGGIPKAEDLLYPYTLGKPKALLPIVGKPMIVYLIDALQAAESIGEIVLVGLDQFSVEIDEIVVGNINYVANQGGQIDNLIAGLKTVQEKYPLAKKVLICSSDVPLLTGEMIDRFIQQCNPFDAIFYYPVVTLETMERRFPHSARTFVRFANGVSVSGGDIMLADVRLNEISDPELAKVASNARKYAWKFAWKLGPKIFLKFLFRRLSLAEAEQIGSRLLRGAMKVVLSECAELGMDLDKPEHLRLIEKEFAH